MIVRLVDAGHVFVTVADRCRLWYGSLLFAGDAKVACHLQRLLDTQVNSLSLGGSQRDWFLVASRRYICMLASGTSIRAQGWCRGLPLGCRSIFKATLLCAY